jgi:hypothetical protein
MINVRSLHWSGQVFLIGLVRYGCLHYYKITDARENIPGSHILGETMNLTYKIDIHA